MISAAWDIFPTVSEMLGLKTPKGLDGISILPELLGNKENQKQHEYLYWEFHEKGGRQAVRMGDWKAVKYNVFKKPNAPIELYNLSNDIGEKKNVAAQNPQIVKKMEGLLKSARTQSSVFTFSQKTFLAED